MNTASTPNRPLFEAIPAATRPRLLGISIGWILVAAVEACAYTILALAIVHQQSSLWVLTSAISAIIITVMVTRSGFLTGVRLAGDLFAALGHSLSSAKLSWFNDQRRAVISKTAGQEIPNFMSIPAHQLQTFLHAPCLPLFICIGLAVVADTGMMLVALTLIVLSLAIQLWAQYALNKTDAQRHQAELDSATATLELVEHLSLLRTAAGPAHALDSIQQNWMRQENLLSRINLSAAWATLIATIANVLPMAGMALYCILSGQSNERLILAALLLMGRAGAPLSALATAGLSINDLISSLRHFQQLTNPPVLSQAATTHTPQQPHLSLHNLVYNPESAAVNLDIPVGSRVHVAGTSGSGKSTLLQLCMRFDDPAQGEIRLDGISLPQLSPQALAANMAYVAQNPIIFTGTLADNIRIGRFDASDAEIETIARQCALGQIIDRADEGIHQNVGQQGSALSGGEQQRVAIARALIKHAPILILDEATSALDENTEQQLIKTILAQSQTLIFVSHRSAAPWQPTQTLDLSS
ncbi:ABC transporter ATP-binding protein [Snodgrassella sp. ESL0253]|uniref:ATP-binding cassette domain-containing protein n=1 Tax=Snodgrassella sp. ESL0253 TaxID=2705031 RepID=UPI00158187AC|nr:ABC transporter ATP-binding protein [Snodgrassella sp. ESL0253]NUE66334.1 ABC transporter ATP-binding protein [Snodgrassella sp. ESL0253]